MNVRIFSALGLIGLLALGATVKPADAAMFVEGADPTTTFASLLLDDVTPGTGQDSGTFAAFNLDRDLAVPTGAGPVEVTIDGIGLNPRGGTSTTEETVDVIVTYLGADLTFGGADDVLLGTQSATLQFGGVNEYTAVFDTPLTAVLDGLANRFRVRLESTGLMRFKNWNVGQSPSGQEGPKLSVGGSASVVPEPTSLALLAAVAGLAGMRRRERKS